LKVAMPSVSAVVAAVVADPVVLVQVAPVQVDLAVAVPPVSVVAEPVVAPAAPVVVVPVVQAAVVNLL
jgi:hypothetical protein